MIGRRADVLPVECVVRGYLAGSGWKEYVATGAVCGIELPPGLREGDRLPEPIFTPAWKAPAGIHDENIPFARVASLISHELATRVREASFALYRPSRGCARAGIILADTKSSSGPTRPTGPAPRHELLTPDSSRFWDAASWQPGAAADYDKQSSATGSTGLGWDKRPPGRPCPPTSCAPGPAHVEAFERITAPRSLSSWRRTSSPMSTRRGAGRSFVRRQRQPPGGGSSTPGSGRGAEPAPPRGDGVARVRSAGASR